MLKGSYDGKTWSVIDERTDQAFQWRLQTRAFQIDKPGRYAHYRLEVTKSTGATTALAEIELLANPAPACTTTVTGKVSGLSVSKGVTCLVGATVAGSAIVSPGASLYAYDSTIAGSFFATGAKELVLRNSTIGGAASITGTSAELALEDTKIGGAALLTANSGDPAPLIAGSTVGGPLACVLNHPAPVNNGLANTVRGPAAGQCAKL